MKIKFHVLDPVLLLSSLAVELVSALIANFRKVRHHKAGIEITLCYLRLYHYTMSMPSASGLVRDTAILPAAVSFPLILVVYGGVTKWKQNITLSSGLNVIDLNMSQL